MFSIFYIRHTYPAMNFPVFAHGFDLPILHEMLKIGLPLGLNTALYSVGHVLLQALYNTLGSTFVAGCSVAGKVSGIANIAITSYSSAATVFAGQNLGARNYRRLCRGAWQIPLCSGIVTLAGGLLVTAFCHPLLMLFSRDPAVLAFAQRYTYLVLPFTWAYAVFRHYVLYQWYRRDSLSHHRKYSAIIGLSESLPLISSCMPAMANMPWSVFPPALLPA